MPSKPDREVERPDHGRTPENTPIPGGGRWRWDEVAGAWVPVPEQEA